MGGIFSLIFGSVLNVVALGYGNAILLSSSSSLSIIFNTIFSVIILKEKVHKSDFAAGFLICFGSILFLMLAKNENKKFSEEELFALYKRPLAITYIMIQLVFIFSAIYLDRSIKQRTKRFYEYCRNSVEQSSLFQQLNKSDTEQQTNI